MGLYRYFLALCVVCSHFSVFSAFTLNIGTIAVVSFFIISGFVMHGQLANLYQPAQWYSDFYKDRLLRIVPQYLFYVCLAFVARYLQAEHQISFLGDQPLQTWLKNFTLIPLGYPYIFNIYNPFILIPQAWSLAIELSFYAVAPLVFFKLSKRAETLLFVFSLGWFCIAFTDFIPSELMGYRLLTGCLFLFQLGKFLAQEETYKTHLQLAMIVCALLLLVAFISPNIQYYASSREIPLGVLIGLPVINLLKNKKSNKLDKLFGHISYGLFLNHFTVLWLLSHFFQLGASENLHRLIIIGAATVLAYLTYTFIEKPLRRFRFDARKQPA